MKKPSRKPGKTPGGKGRGSRSATKDAVALLKADHRKVEGLFRKAEKASGGAKESLVQQICNELIVHTLLEEEIFYPACREQDVEEDIMDEAQVEHDGAKVLISDLMDVGPESEMYDAKVSVLSEYIKHHVKEEEKPRTGVFAEAKRKGLDLEELGLRLSARKQELMQQAEDEGLPHPTPKSIGHDGAGRASDDRERNEGVGVRLLSIAQAAKKATFGE